MIRLGLKFDDRDRVSMHTRIINRDIDVIVTKDADRSE